MIPFVMAQHLITKLFVTVGWHTTNSHNMDDCFTFVGLLEKMAENLFNIAAANDFVSVTTKQQPFLAQIRQICGALQRVFEVMEGM
jgi:hypothetical protein